MSKLVFSVWVGCCAFSVWFVVSLWTGVSAAPVRSDNMRLVANYSEDGAYRTGTDMAFWGDIALLGNLDQGTGPTATPPGGFRIMDISKPSAPRKLGQFTCLGDQSDVSIWRHLVILSVDKPTSELCTEGTANWEGIRIISIDDVTKPRILKTVATDCGSHTNTIVPDLANDRLIVYVLSYPLAGRYNPAPVLPTCNAQTHRKFSVVEVPLSDPTKAKVLDTPSVAPTIGCHDVTVFLERKLAAAACLTESQIWDISDPAKPKIVSHIENPRGMNLSHSTIFSLDGRKLVVGDELGGAALSPGCISDDQRFVLGGLFFFDVADPASPKLTGTYKLPREVASEFCTAHLFNVVPTRSNRDILVSSWYTGATSVIDFTDPAKAVEIAHYIPDEPVTKNEQPTEAAAWASYWYNGFVYSNNFDEDVNSAKPRSRGLDVFAVDDARLADAVRLPRLNPQVQEPLPPVQSSPGAGSIIGLPGQPAGQPGAPGKQPASGRRCRSGKRLAIKIRTRRRQRVRSVTVFVNGTRSRARYDRKRRQVVLRRLPAGRVRVDVTVRLRGGRKVESRRTYRICARR